MTINQLNLVILKIYCLRLISSSHSCCQHRQVTNLPLECIAEEILTKGSELAKVATLTLLHPAGVRQTCGDHPQIPSTLTMTLYNIVGDVSIVYRIFCSKFKRGGAFVKLGIYTYYCLCVFSFPCPCVTPPPSIVRFSFCAIKHPTRPFFHSITADNIYFW